MEGLGSRGGTTGQIEARIISYCLYVVVVAARQSGRMNLQWSYLLGVAGQSISDAALPHDMIGLRLPSLAMLSSHE